jgi:hypothetical protein
MGPEHQIDSTNGAMRVMHVIEAMGQGGAEAMIVEHVRHAGPGVESVVVALRRGGAALDAAVAPALPASCGVPRAAGLTAIAISCVVRGAVRCQ